MTASDRAAATPKPGRLAPDWLDAHVPEGYTVAAVGDIILTRPIYEQLQRQSPELLAILQQADLVVGNFESTVLDMQRFDGHPSAESGFGWLNSPPEVATDLRRLGFDMMARANNHSTDWGAAGLRMTDELLISAGLACAGTGPNLSAARAPGYVHGPKASSTLVSWTTTFERDTPAIDAQGTYAGRPGASTLATTSIAMVSPAQFAALKAIRDAQPPELRPALMIEFDERHDMVTLFAQHYMVHPEGSTDTSTVRVHYKMDEQDRQGILLNIRQAKQSSDFTVAASHTHEPNNWTTTPPDFFPPLARAAIDNGADLVCGHGPHQLRGIEIYKGKSILYSLGDFCFTAQNNLPREEWERRVWRMLPDAPSLDPTRTTAAEFMEWARVAGAFGESVWFESVVAIATYGVAGRVRQIELVPIELNWAERHAHRGIPRLAPRDKGLEILRRLAALSAPMGTVVEIDEAKAIGMIRAD